MRFMMSYSESICLPERHPGVVIIFPHIKHNRTYKKLDATSVNTVVTHKMSI